MKFFILSKEGFGEGLTPPPSPLGLGGPKTLKAEGRIFENCLQNKRLQINLGSARYHS